jgi:YD repeat-containing protein
MKTIVNTLIVLAALTCSIAIPASAQLPGSCWHYGTGITPLPYPGAYDCVPDFIGAYTCKFWNSSGGVCLPPEAPSETNPKGTCPACNGGSPINFITGNTFIEETDVHIPGLSGGLTLTRVWNSKWPSSESDSQTGLFGPNWRSTYEERLFAGCYTPPEGEGWCTEKYARSDGSFWSWIGAGSLVVAAPANVAGALSANCSSGCTSWTITFPNGEQRIFSWATGSLTSIIDRNGNTTSLSYDALNRLVTVADPGGRHLYFSYASDTSYLVTSITSDVGISLSYAYDSQGRLTQVTKPDSTILSFEYDSNSMITAVKDNDGNVLESHTYDALGRGLTSSRASGVDAVTVSY